MARLALTLQWPRKKALAAVCCCRAAPTDRALAETKSNTLRLAYLFAQLRGVFHACKQVRLLRGHASAHQCDR